MAGLVALAGRISVRDSGRRGSFNVLDRTSSCWQGRGKQGLEQSFRVTATAAGGAWRTETEIFPETVHSDQEIRMAASTEDRLERLEHELSGMKRRYRRLVFGMFVLAATGGVIAWSGHSPRASASVQSSAGVQDTVRARAFILQDRNGQHRAKLGIVETFAGTDSDRALDDLSTARTGPGLVLFDQLSRKRAMLAIDQITDESYAPKFVLYGEEGERRAVLNATAGLFLQDHRGQRRATLSGTGSGASLSLHDSAGEQRINLHLSEALGMGPSIELADLSGTIGATLDIEGPGPGLALFGENGDEGAILGVGDRGATVGLVDTAGTARASLSLTDIGGVLELRDESGGVRSQLGAGRTKTQDGRRTTFPESSLRLFNPDGNLIWSAPR